MAELENVMHRLDAQTKRLQEQSRSSQAGDDDKALMLQGLALVSEAVLKIGRDIRFLRLHLAEKA